MYCPFCGSELPDDARYCNHCGKKLPNLNADTPIKIEHVPEPPLKQDSQSKIPQPQHNKNKTTRTTIIVCAILAVVILVGIIGVVALLNSSSTVSEKSIVGEWSANTLYYDSEISQYATISYTFYPDGSGVEKWGNYAKGYPYYTREIQWTGKNNKYTLHQKESELAYTFTVNGDRAYTSYDISFTRVREQSATPVPTKNPTVNPTKAPTVTPTPVPTQKQEEYIKRNYNWEYNGYEFTTSCSFPKSTYDYYKKLGHGSSNLAKYATDSANREIVSEIADSILSATDGFSEYDKVMSVVSFVQSLPYTSDSATTGHDEYPRYPIETLVDNGGDCEDTAILTAAILREMGYGCALLVYDNHVAVGIKGGDGIYGSYYTKDGDKYFYLETTGKNWDVGEVPDAYKSAKASVIVIN